MYITRVNSGPARVNSCPFTCFARQTAIVSPTAIALRIYSDQVVPREMPLECSSDHGSSISGVEFRFLVSNNGESPMCRSRNAPSQHATEYITKQLKPSRKPQP